MTLPDILFTTLIISLFCCGLTVVTGEGMILHFLKKPFVKLGDLMAMRKSYMSRDIKQVFKLTFEAMIDEPCRTLESIEASLGDITRRLQTKKKELTGDICDKRWLETFEGEYEFSRKETRELSIKFPSDEKGYIQDVVLIKTYDEPRDWNWVLHWLKPIILCTTCMGSFWGIVIFASLHGFHVELVRYMIICCFMSCFLNAFFMSKYNAG